ncbi:hypothetical protein [Bifidobacterium sp. SO1]|uniref:hypothetical protein n=1 Tax=Bifidobacterium sp. SO1 TaxID=2809029 RepID=UPI001BDD4DE2|nr:hypothetical protein [Bifidobacterium sp. SO1]MBT1162152.1 hypothetical protein [Bifidobacterium sp. SO1]
MSDGKPEKMRDENMPSLSEIIFSDPRCIAYLEAARPYEQIPKKVYHQFTYRLRLMRQSQIKEFSNKPDADKGSSADSEPER